jgi:hypothetical protein
MPITNFQLIGKWNKPGQGYSPQDVGILTNPAAVEKIHKKWSNTKENFDFYFVKQPGASQYVEIGEVTPEWVKDKLKLDIQPNPSNITVIFTNNRGDEKVPMTAWIMAHRMGHALRRGNHWENFASHLQRDFAHILRGAYNYDYKGNIGWGEDAYKKYRMDNNALLDLATAVGTMRSARMGNLRNWFEMAYELLAQRLLTGKIKFNSLPQCITPDRKMAWGRPIGRRYCGDPEELAEWSEALKGYGEYYEHLLDETIKSLVGKIFVM